MIQPIKNKLSLPCLAEEADSFLSQPGSNVLDLISDEEGDFMVLGAGGKIGLHLCLMLKSALETLGKRNRVFAVSRFNSLRGKEPFTKAGVICISADLSDENSLQQLPECKNIFFLAGAKFGTSRNKSLLTQMNVLVPSLVVKRFPKARFAAYSTGCVYPFSNVQSKGSTEVENVVPNGDYARSCVGRENVFLETAMKNGTAVSIIRLNYSVDFYYGVLVDICRQVMDMEIIDLSTGHFNVIWQRDAVEYSILSLFHASQTPFIINVTGDEVLLTRKVAQQFSQLLGMPVSFKGEESSTAWLSDASLCFKLWGKPKTSVDAMIEWTAAWMSQIGEIHGKPTGFQVRDGKF